VGVLRSVRVACVLVGVLSSVRVACVLVGVLSSVRVACVLVDVLSRVRVAGVLGVIRLRSCLVGDNRRAKGVRRVCDSLAQDRAFRADARVLS
jgi:hypothetical protein